MQPATARIESRSVSFAALRSGPRKSTRLVPLEYFGVLHGGSHREARAAAHAWLGRVGLGDRASVRVEELSHRNQPRVQLAAALVHRPDLLVLDEPFAGLDPIATDVMADVLREEARRGVPVILSSHQLGLVEQLCESVAIIARSRPAPTNTKATPRSSTSSPQRSRPPDTTAKSAARGGCRATVGGCRECTNDATAAERLRPNAGRADGHCKECLGYFWTSAGEISQAHSSRPL
jgi:ABC-type multidrug transport system ATPase subunit